MQTCLLCSRIIKQTLTFSEFFLLKNKRNLICNKCQSLFKKIPNERCPRCSKSNSKGICADCIKWEEKGIIVNHQAIFIYNQEMKDYFSLYKFMGDYRLHEVFDSYFKNLSKKIPLVPIPVSPKRLQERGFNQVTAFLKDRTYLDLLEKEDTVRQSSLNREGRLSTTNPFKLKEGEKIPQKIILIDDIYTTGTTFYHAIKTLKKANPIEITTFSLCR